MQEALPSAEKDCCQRQHFDAELGGEKALAFLHLPCKPQKIVVWSWLSGGRFDVQEEPKGNVGGPTYLIAPAEACPSHLAQNYFRRFNRLACLGNLGASGAAEKGLAALGASMGNLSLALITIFAFCTNLHDAHTSSSQQQS